MANSITQMSIASDIRLSERGKQALIYYQEEGISFLRLAKGEDVSFLRLTEGEKVSFLRLYIEIIFADM